MKLFKKYETPSLFSGTVMVVCDLMLRVLIPLRPQRRLPIELEQIKKLLVLRLDGIGDNICSWPALETLRQALPAAHISLAVGPWAAPLYKECPWIDEIVEWDSALFGLFRGKGLGGLSKDVLFPKIMHSREFDVGIDLRGDILSILLLWLINPPVRVAHISRGGARLLTDPLFPQNDSEAQRAYDVVKAVLGCSSPVRVPPIKDWSRPRARGRVLGRDAEIDWESQVPKIALCPGALWPWKRWPRERFLSLAEKLKLEFGATIVWFLESASQATAYASGDPVFCGPLDEVAAALGLCTLAVSNDSGLLHLAVAAGCRTVQLFGPGDAERFSHTGDGLVLLHDTSCQRYPCVQRGECRNLAEGWCLEKISVDEVFAACSKLLAE